MKSIVLKAGREKSVLRRHPWLFSGAIERVLGEPAGGETVRVASARGEFLAYAAYSPQSQIRARIWSFDAAATIDASFMAAALRKAAAVRARMLPPATEAWRVVHGESDGLPGVVIDRYADTAVMQLSSAGAERWREAYAQAAVALGNVRRVYERSDLEVRRLEGLAARVGPVIGDEPADAISVREAAAHFLVDVRHGQKTGFFLDQRDNRAKVCRAARDREVLDVFSYTGGFALAALSGGASHVTAIDSAADALAAAHANLIASGLDASRITWIEADAFGELRRLCDRGQRFDLIVLDPPKFAPTEKHVARAARAYKDVNLWALRLLRPGGMLYTFSCSGGVDAALFQSIVAGAALDAGVNGRIIERLGAAADHPIALNFPEGEYLKGLVVQV
ncbi:MAG: class I SAM-dependent methyltransferase [Burkholderiales bacterium]|nr:class I SAM-dependent methyltransferase [Burkholderiales bacterium]